MEWYTNRKLSAKLFIAFGVLLVLTAGLGVFSIAKMQQMNAATIDIGANWLPRLNAARGVQRRALEYRIGQYRYVADRSSDGVAAAKVALGGLSAAVVKASADYTARMTTQDESTYVATFNRQWATYTTQWAEVDALKSSGNHDAATVLLIAASRPLFLAADSTVDSLVSFNERRSAIASTTAAATYRQSRIWLLGLIVVCVAFGLTVAQLLARRLVGEVTTVARLAAEVRTRCIVTIRSALEGMAKGDLNATVRTDVEAARSSSVDELGDLSRTVDLMIDDVRATVIAFQTTQSTVRDLVVDTRTLARAAQAGTLDERADPTRYAGAYRDLIDGMNGTLEAVAAPMREMQEVLGRVADRDLSARMAGEYKGAYAAIKDSVNTAVEQLDSTLMQVNSASAQVASAGSQITSSAQSLASGSSEQAASLEEVSASVHVFASMAQQSASNAGEARSLAASARADTQEGSARMGRLTTAVNEIKQASAATARIVKTIDEIAFQTNLLALNAAVEAARAGDAGRGFAVVAEEVRSLALRAAEAAKSTSGLIEEGQAAAARGILLNGEVTQSLDRIGAQIVRVAEVTAEISASTEQQVDGVTQIKQAVDQINIVTQQVAANAEESASAATELESQAQTLRDMVAAFRLTDAPAGRSAGHGRTDAIGAGRPAVRRPARAAATRPAPVPRVTAAALAASAIPFDEDDDSALSGF